MSKCDEIEIQIFPDFWGGLGGTKAAEIYAITRTGALGAEGGAWPWAEVGGWGGEGLGPGGSAVRGVDRNSDLLVHQLVLVAYQS